MGGVSWPQPPEPYQTLWGRRQSKSILQGAEADLWGLGCGRLLLSLWLFNSPASSPTPPPPQEGLCAGQWRIYKFRGTGTWGRGAPVTSAQRRQQSGGLHGPAATQLFHTGPERKVGPSLTTAFDRQQAESPRRRVSLVLASFTPSLSLGVNTSLYLFILPLFLIP